MKTMKLNTVLALTLGSLNLVSTFIPGLASAGGLTRLPGPLHVHCEGSAGSVDANLNENVLDYSVHASGVSESGTVSPKDDPNGGEYSPGGEAFDTVSEEGDAHWISLGGSIAKNVWVPEHKSCLPTRVVGRCSPITVPGAFEHQWNQWFDLLVNVTPSGYTFGHVELTHQTVSTLGAGTSCTVN
jgi:hypothetical protein